MRKLRPKPTLRSKCRSLCLVEHSQYADRCDYATCCFNNLAQTPWLLKSGFKLKRHVSCLRLQTLTSHQKTSSLYLRTYRNEHTFYAYIEMSIKCPPSASTHQPPATAALAGVPHNSTIRQNTHLMIKPRDKIPEPRSLPGRPSATVTAA